MTSVEGQGGVLGLGVLLGEQRGPVGVSERALRRVIHIRAGDTQVVGFEVGVASYLAQKKRCSGSRPRGNVEKSSIVAPATFCLQP